MMKKLLSFFMIIAIANATVYHIKSDKVKENNKNFRDSLSFLQEKYQKLAMEISKIEEPLMRARDELVAKGEAATDKERLDFEKQAAYLMREKMSFREELAKDQKLIEEQFKREISNILGNNVSLDSNVVLYGGEDITKYMISRLEDKPADLKKISGSIKVGYLDKQRFMKNSKDIAENIKFLNSKREKLTEKQQEAIAAVEKGGNIEDFKSDLESLNEDVQRAEKMLSQIIESNLRKAAKYIAKMKSLDIICDNELILSGGVDVTEDFLVHYGQDSEQVVGNATYVLLDKVVMEYNKAKKLLEKHQKQANALQEELNNKRKDIQKMKDDKKSQEEIKKAEEALDKEEAVRVQSLNSSMMEDYKNIMQDIKNAAQKLGASKKYQIIFSTILSANSLLYAGKDVTEELISVINE